MICSLIALTWFDIATVGFTVIVTVLVQLINAIWVTFDEAGSKSLRSDNNEVTKSFKKHELKSLISNDSTTVNTTAANSKLKKQQSEQHENGSLLSSTPSSIIKTSSTSPPPLLSSLSLSSLTSSSSHPLNVRHSLSSLLSGNTASILPHTSSFPDNLSDEYHEDEDTISLENLFPCDQTEIYASKKISFIIDELIQTEGNYINNLRKGLQNYGNLKQYDKLPELLKDDEKQQELLGNVAEILELHEKEILPLMLRNKRDLKGMFDEMSQFIEKNQFYCYVTFTMHKKTSFELRKDPTIREFLMSYQNEINDRLGIDSFLVQPIQRLTRYPLLLQQFISEFYKNGINCKPVLVSVCKLETRMRRLLEVVNQAEEVLSIDELTPELSISQFGPFRRSTEFEAYNHRGRKKFRSKVFLFDHCLVCTEVRKRRLAYRHHYAWDAIELQLNNSKSITLLSKPGHGVRSTSPTGSNSHTTNKEEYEFSSPEAISINQWLRCARRIIENGRFEESQRGKFSLPMDLILFVVFAIWLIWHYL